MSVAAPRTARTWRDAATALCFYIAASVALTWPVAARPSAVLLGDFGDGRGWVAWLWAKSHGLLDGAANPLLAAPFGMPVGSAVHHPLPEALALALTAAVGEIAAANLLVLIAFPMTAFATYVVLRRLLGSGLAAFFGGLAFGFCPAAIMQAAGGHVLYAFNVFLPLFVLSLLHNRSSRSWRSALLVALAYAGIVLSALYFGFFALLLGIFFVGFDLATRQDEAPSRIMINYAGCVGFALALILPFEWGLVHEQLSHSAQAIAQSGHARGIGELWVYAAHPWSYLLPSIDHPIFGPAVAPFVSARLQGSNAFEQTLYLGLVPLALVVAGLVAAVKRSFQPELRVLFWFFALAASCMYFISMPPMIAAGVPMPSYVLHDVFPMFRVYARAGIIVAFLVACAAAVVLAHLQARLPARRYGAMVAVLGTLLVVEYWAPPAVRDVSAIPPVYSWLASQPGEWVVAEYPMARYDQAAFYTYAFWQRVHGKKLANGATPENPKAWNAFEHIVDLSDAQTPARLKSLGVKYVVMHKQMYREGPIPGPIKPYYSPAESSLKYNGGELPVVPPGLVLDRVFGNDVVFAIAGA